eukprot:6916497-Alexandrium_andersonii.AAC.1
MRTDAVGALGRGTLLLPELVVRAVPLDAAELGGGMTGNPVNLQLKLRRSDSQLGDARLATG